LKTAELHEAILLQFKRLASTQEARTNVCQTVFGKAIDTWEKVKQLRDDDLRRGLAKLAVREPIVEDVPNYEPPKTPSSPVDERSERGPTPGMGEASIHAPESNGVGGPGEDADAVEYATAAEVERVRQYAATHHLSADFERARAHHPHGMRVSTLMEIEADLKGRVEA
jgi:hypothetical protein